MRLRLAEAKLYIILLRLLLVAVCMVEGSQLGVEIKPLGFRVCDLLREFVTC